MMSFVGDAKKSTLALSELRVFLRALLACVGRLHSQGYIHRDIKPENIALSVGVDSIVLWLSS